MKIVTLIALSFATALIAQEPDHPRSAKTAKDVRFQIIEGSLGNGRVMIKIDTLTGKSWILRILDESEKRELGIVDGRTGYTYIWDEISDVALVASAPKAAPSLPEAVQPKGSK